jgi:hypothetical protein
MRDGRTPQDRAELAASLREIRRQCGDPDYARAFCRAVLANFRTGLAVVPRQTADGKWCPRRRRLPDAKES